MKHSLKSFNRKKRNFPKEISPVHVSSFQGVWSAIFLASSTSMLYKMKVTLNATRGKDGRNSSAVLEEVAGHRPHPTHSNEDGPTVPSKLSCEIAFGVLGRRVLLLMVAGSSIHTNARVSELDGDPPQRPRSLRFY